MTEQGPTPEEQATQDADSALYESIYAPPARLPLTEEDETLYATFYAPPARVPLTDEDEALYNSLIPEN